MAKKKAATKPSDNKVRASIRITPETLKRARVAAYWTPGTTLSSLVEEALIREIDRMEKKRGEPFPEGAVKLTPGRPVKP